MSTVRIPEMASRCLRETQHPESALNELVCRIRDSVKAIDPSVKRVGAIYDFGAAGYTRLTGILIDREDAPMIVKPGGNVFDDKTPDYDLLRLGAMFRKAFNVEAEARDHGMKTGDWEAWDCAHAICTGLVDEIEKLPAKTMPGLKIKALCVLWCHSGDPIELTSAQTTDVRFCQAIVQDLLSMGGTNG